MRHFVSENGGLRTDTSSYVGCAPVLFVIEALLLRDCDVVNFSQFPQSSIRCQTNQIVETFAVESITPAL